MTTNGEWLDYLAHNAPDELAAWFDAEHVETANAALDGDTEPENADSRERLETDAFAYLQTAYITYPQIIELLDRQAAITAEETSNAWEEYRDATQREIAELTAERDELEAEHERIVQEMVDANTRQCERTNELINERERYREKFGKCIDYADAIHALMDYEGMA